MCNVMQIMGYTTTTKNIMYCCSAVLTRQSLGEFYAVCCCIGRHSDPLRRNASNPSFAPRPISCSAVDRAATTFEHAGADTRRCNLRSAFSGIRRQTLDETLRKMEVGGQENFACVPVFNMEADRPGGARCMEDGSPSLLSIPFDATMGTSVVCLRRQSPIADGERAAGGQGGGGVGARLGGGETCLEHRSGFVVAMDILRPRG